VGWPAGTLVIPSILSADFGAFRSQVVELLDAGARAFHVDVMDGHFVPVITFGPRVVSSFADLVHERGGTIDVHLMIEQPERQLPEFAQAGADSCTVHVETCPHLHYTLGLIHELGMTAGATLNPATPTAALREAAREADVLLCMSVNPGWGGQKFIEASIDRLGELRALLRPGMGLEVDGGVAPATIARCHAAGANLMVAGSAIYSQPSPGEAWRALSALVAGA
jgi:ribulose-phosphate 3-epimerase